MKLQTSIHALIMSGVLAASSAAFAEGNQSDQSDAQAQSGAQMQSGDQAQGQTQAQNQQDGQGNGVRQDIAEAQQVLQKLQSNQELQQALSQAQGVFVVPDYATASLILGGAGGEGVLFTQQNGQWGSPVMYNIGSVSAGLQAGAAAGSIAMLLMSDNALQSFNEENNFSLNAEAGLSVVNWSKRVRANLTQEGDVLVWTDTEGLLGELSLSVADIHYDDEETGQYYGQQVTPDAIMTGQVSAPSQQQRDRTVQR